MQLAGGPLDGCTARADRETIESGTMRVFGEGGRYVVLDADEWVWEDDDRSSYTGRHRDQGGAPMDVVNAGGDVVLTVPDSLTASPAPLGVESLSWRPGDPCRACGSRRTVWGSDTGAACLDCHRTDADD